MTSRRSPSITPALFVILAALAGCSGNNPVGPTSSGVAPSAPVAAVARCGPGADPDQPGPDDQPRPILQQLAPAAMDVQSGEVITFDGSHTWSFNVCTNTWRRADPVTELGTGMMSTFDLDFAYDAGDHVVVAFHRESARPWVYSVATNTWSQQPASETPAPPDVGNLADLAYEPMSGDVVLRDRESGELWAYDVGQNVWSNWSHGDAFPHGDRNAHDLLAVDTRVGQIVYVLPSVDSGLPSPGNGQTWTYDITGRSWAQQDATPPPLNTGWFESGGEIAYDPLAESTVIFSDGLVAAYDATSQQWSTKPASGWTVDAYTTVGSEFGSGPLARLGHTMLYDPVNTRIVVLGGQSRMPGEGWQELADVWAYDVRTNTWTPLLSPSASSAD